MKFSLHFGSLALLLVSTPLSYSRLLPRERSARALYTLDNNSNGSSIVAIGVGGNGELSGTTMTPTGGRGLAAITAQGQPAVGSLFSSDSVVVKDNYLFVVNSGSNTVSMFYINPSNPMRPILVGKPANTLGEFPMSLTYSSKLSTLCVLNGGAIAGVTCFSVDRQKGLTALDTAPRSIAQGLNQTTPPVGPFLTASDIMFNPSSSAIIVSIKGTPLTTPVTPGFIYAWPVSQGRVSIVPVVTSIPSIILDFSLTFVGTDFDLLITDPALGADILNVTPDLNITVNQPVNVTYERAICWSVYSDTAKAIFLIDTARGNITVLNPQDGSILQTIDYAPTGATDSTVLGENFYTVTQSGRVLRIDLGENEAGEVSRQVQTFTPAVPNPSNAPAILVGLAGWQPS